MKPNKWLLFSCVIFLLYLTLCSYGERPPIAIWKTSSGKEYKIFKIGVWRSKEYPKMFTIRFRSENSQDTTVSFKEFHDMRHCYASRLVMAGVDLKTVMDLLGHKDIKMTMRYSHLSTAHKKNAVKKLDVCTEKKAFVESVCK